MSKYADELPPDGFLDHFGHIDNERHVGDITGPIMRAGRIPPGVYKYFLSRPEFIIVTSGSLSIATNTDQEFNFSHDVSEGVLWELPRKLPFHVTIASNGVYCATIRPRQGDHVDDAVRAASAFYNASTTHEIEVALPIRYEESTWT